jgi:hypothetical protein
MRPYQYLIFAFASVFLIIFILFFIVRSETLEWNTSVYEKKKISSIVGFYDLALSSEARQIRHRSYSDFFSAFSHMPSGFDLFPSGAFYLPPTYIIKQQNDQ